MKPFPILVILAISTLSFANSEPCESRCGAGEKHVSEAHHEFRINEDFYKVTAPELDILRPESYLQFTPTIPRNISIIFFYGCHACEKFEQDLAKRKHNGNGGINYLFVPMVMDSFTEELAKIFYVSTILNLGRDAQPAIYKLVLDRFDKNVYEFDRQKDAYPLLIKLGASQQAIDKAYSSSELRDNISNARRLSMLKKSPFLPGIIVGNEYEINMDKVETFDEMVTVSEFVANQQSLWNFSN